MIIHKNTNFSYYIAIQHNNTGCAKSHFTQSFIERMRPDHNFLQEKWQKTRRISRLAWPVWNAFRAEMLCLCKVPNCEDKIFFEKFVAKKTPVSKGIMKVYFCEFYESMLIKECYLCSICFHLVTQRKKQDVKRDIKEECKSCLPLEEVGFEAIFFSENSQACLTEKTRASLFAGALRLVHTWLMYERTDE